MERIMAAVSEDKIAKKVSLPAPAKLNLTLEVLARRKDGYHDIRSIIQAISFGDKISFRPGSVIDIKCNHPGWLSEESLVSKAVALLSEVTGYQRGATIRIDKKIPLLSGLGGDSSDAATILKGLNELWGLGLTRWQLAELAQQLGSDTAFFIFGGTAMVEGRGEVVTLLPALPRMWVVLLVPPVAREKGKTGRLYDSLDKEHFTDGHLTDDLMMIITGGGEITSSSLYNVFEKTAFDIFGRLDEFRWRFLEAGAYQVGLAGSGPTLYSLIDDRKRAEKIYQSLRKKGFEVYLAETICPLE
jgi:4-diphosphocytidyl-2-C-methyl-D-erythritol kinase